MLRRGGAALMLAVLSSPSPARAGSLKGTVVFPPARETATKTPEPRPLAYWRVENGVVPIAPAPDTRGDVVVILEPVGRNDAPPAAVTIEARPLRFEPRLTVAAPRAPITIKNSDKIPRTTYLRNGELFIPRQTTAPGATREIKFTELGEYPIVDADNPRAVALILVVAAPYSARVDEKGGFNVDAPDGKYTLKTWYHGSWGDPVSVEVGKQKEVSVKLSERPERAAAEKKE